jgi:hypothetical protein
MRTLKGLIASIAIVSLTLISYPGVSFGQDCSYSEVFNPPLPSQSGFCVASGSLKSGGSLLVTASNWLFVTQNLQLRVNEQPLQGFPFTPIPGSLRLAPGGVLGTIQPVLDPIQINAVGAIINDQGALNLFAPNDTVTLTAGKGISLDGNPAIGFDPSSLVVADTIKLQTTKGNIFLDNNTVLLSIGDQADVSLVAPRGTITVNGTIAVVRNGSFAELGICSFQAKTPASVIFGPGANVFCIPNIKK